MLQYNSKRFSNYSIMIDKLPMIVGEAQKASKISKTLMNRPIQHGCGLSWISGYSFIRDNVTKLFNLFLSKGTHLELDKQLVFPKHLKHLLKMFDMFI
jgi:hypothetical protein